MNNVKKMMVIVAHLIETPEAYEGKTNENIEKDILDELPVIPYVAHIETVTVFDCL